MKKNIYLIMFLLSAIVVNAQQLPQYSNYVLNNYMLNPAAGGVNPYFEGKATNRYQWMGFTDAPRTYILSVNGPTKNLKMGLGGSLFTDIVGPTRRTGFYLSYAYQMKVADKVKVSLGLSAGLLQFVVDGSKISLRDPSDLVITNSLQTSLMPDFGAGAYVYSTDKKWFVGLSVPQILQEQIHFYDNSTAELSKIVTHVYGTAGYNFALNDDFKIEPSTCVKFVSPAPVQFDLGVRSIYKDNFWLGAYYRHLDAISVMAGVVLLENITVAYAYDFTTTNIKKYSSGSSEITIGVKFHKAKPKGDVSVK